jgi:hypothetical protein
MKSLKYICLLPLLAVSACHPAPPNKPPDPSAQVSAMIDSLYKQVLARHPLGIPDRKVFGPYLSKGLLHGFDLDNACFDRWSRANPGDDLKPPFGTLELGVFSGGVEEAGPQTFHIEKVEAEKDGSYRALVTLTYAEPSFKLTWQVAPIVIPENGRFVVNNVIYLKQDNLDEYRLSDTLIEDCRRQQPRPVEG